MTPEKFRQWIVILFALSILTVWVAIGVKMSKWDKYGAMSQKNRMMRQMPGMMPRRGTMPKRRIPTKRTAPATKPAPPTETAK